MSTAISNFKMSTQEYLEVFHGAKRKKKNKFNAVKVKDDGITFDSKKEHARYLTLKQQLNSGYITDLQVHPKYVFKEVINDKGKPYTYKPDFSYFNRITNKLVVEDVKSEITARKGEYKLKKALMRAFFKIEVVEV